MGKLGGPIDSDNSGILADFENLFGEITTDTGNIANDEVSFLKQQSNIYRIIASMLGVSAISLYAGSRDVYKIGTKAGIMGLSTIVSIHLAQALESKDYVDINKSEHVILPMSAVIYYLAMSRSLRIPALQNRFLMEAVTGAGAGFVAENYLNTTKKPKSKKEN